METYVPGMPVEAYFPVEWSFGDRPQDGMGGPPVADAGMIFIIKAEEDRSISDTLLGSITVGEMVGNVLDGNVGPDGVIADIHVESCLRLKAALLAAAGRIDAAMPVPTDADHNPIGTEVEP